MFPTCIPFPSSGDKENIPVTRSEKRTRRNALIDGTKGSRRPLLQRVISKGQSITVFTNPARTRAHTGPPTINEKVTPSPLSTIYRPPSLSPLSPCPQSILINPTRTWSLPSIIITQSPSPSVRQSRSPPHITILSDLEREKREAHPLSRPLVRLSRSPPHITILSDPEREKREAHPLSPPLVRLSRSHPHITILSDLEKEKREAHLRSTQRTKSIRYALATTLALKRAPSISITPISILKAPTPPQAPAPAPAPVTDPNPDAVKENVKVKFVLSDIVVQETGQDIRDLEIDTGADKIVTSSGSGEMLCVPLVDWRGRLDEDELSRYYPREHAKEQFAHRLRSMVRSGKRSAAARRRDDARRRRQTAATTSAITSPPPIALISGHTCP